MSSIIIESSPISSAGFCRATNDQSIIFTIVSGITSSTVYCEWFLNNNSVYFGSSYILLTPKTGDSVYARVVNCSGETLRIGNWIEDNMFYYNDVKSGTSTYYIDLKASFNYKILSSVFKSNTGDTVQIKIDDVPIIWSGSGNTINISNSIVDTEAILLNNVSIGQKVTLITNAKNVIRGKIRFIRVMKNYVTPLPTTTTTTTTTTHSPTTTTTTTHSPTTTTTTTSAPPVNEVYLNHLTLSINGTNSSKLNWSFGINNSWLSTDHNIVVRITNTTQSSLTVILLGFAVAQANTFNVEYPASPPGLSSTLGVVNHNDDNYLIEMSVDGNWSMGVIYPSSNITMLPYNWLE